MIFVTRKILGTFINAVILKVHLFQDRLSKEFEKIYEGSKELIHYPFKSLLLKPETN